MDRYTQEANTSSLTLDAPEASPLLNLFHGSTGVTAANSAYNNESNGFYPSHGPLFTSDGRVRLSSNSTSSAGIAHVPLQNYRTTGVANLPHIGPQLNGNGTNGTAAPINTFRRTSDQFSRSPVYAALPRRHQQQLTATSHSQTGLVSYAPGVPRMDSHQQYAHRTSQDIPPLLPIETFGTLQYMDPNMTAAKVDISGVIDKGPFLSSDQEWTCYRRNYLTCVCSFTLTPNYPGVAMQFTPNTNTPMGGSGPQAFQVYGFAMCISAMVSDNEQHNIELVQHTPKRDKGPISKPTKTRLAPKSANAPHGSSLTLYPDSCGLSTSRGGIYGEGFGTGQQSVNQPVPTEHTFERIQFKQATQNNGKRRAAQQYYHLVIELWADVGSQLPEQYVKVALRKSAKMIVRGRSPGHYQNERRNSQGNGAGGSAGSAGYRPMSGMGDFGNGSALAGAAIGSYNATYDSRSGGYHGVRHQYMSPDSMFSTSEDKPTLSNGGKAYGQYYASPSYENSGDRVEGVFAPRGVPDGLHGLGGAPCNDRKPKAEFDFNTLPSPFSGGARADDHHRDKFDGRPSSGAFYPSIVSPAGMSTL